MRLKHAYTAVTAAAAAAVIAAGCGSSGSSTGSINPHRSAPSPTTPKTPGPSNRPATAAHNSTDVTFARNYLALQHQAQTAAALVAAHTKHHDLTTLADHIRQRSHDTEQIRTWLHDWHQPTTTHTPSALPSHATIDAHDLAEMKTHHGTAFNDDWAEHITANHAAAITACQREVHSGANPQARQFAVHRLATLRAEQAQLTHWHDTEQNNDHNSQHNEPPHHN